MAFESINTESTFTKATSLKEGESFQGYYLGSQISDRGYLNFIFDREDGSRCLFSPAGNLKYLEKNKTPLTLGLMTRITKNGSRVNKKGQTVGVYKVEQDRDNKTTRYSDEQLAELDYKDPMHDAVKEMRG